MQDWNPDKVTIGDESVPDSWKVCVIQGVIDGGNEYNGSLGARISSIFVIFFVSTFCTIFPLLAKRSKKFRIPLYGYLFARYFGTGVIVATAFVHLMDPAYQEIGPQSCIGMTGNWAVYSWPPALILLSIFIILYIDIASNVYVDRKFGVEGHDVDVEDIIVNKEEQAAPVHMHDDVPESLSESEKKGEESEVCDSVSELQAETTFRKQISAFLVLEFGIIFHSVMIGLNLGAVGDEFKTLYIVLVFHQSFEGLGLGARLSAIEWPKHLPSWIPYGLCLAYGCVTPICVAIGLGVRTTYNSGSFNANIVQGVLDSLSAGILMYNGLVELLARDFIFDSNATKDLKRLTFSVCCTTLGAGIMALLGKWA